MRPVLFAVLMLFYTNCFSQKVYKCKSNGTTIFSQQPCSDSAQELDMTWTQKHGSDSPDVQNISDAAELSRIDHECTQRAGEIARDAAAKSAAIDAEIAQLQEAATIAAQVPNGLRDPGLHTHIAALHDLKTANETGRQLSVNDLNTECSKRRDESRQRADEIAKKRAEDAAEKAKVEAEAKKAKADAAAAAKKALEDAEKNQQ
jgi:hypothetical protein